MKIVYTEYKEESMEGGKYVYAKIGEYAGETLEEIQKEIGCSDDEEVTGFDIFSNDSSFGKIVSQILEIGDGPENNLLSEFKDFLEGAYWFGRQSALSKNKK